MKVSTLLAIRSKSFLKKALCQAVLIRDGNVQKLDGRERGSSARTFTRLASFAPDQLRGVDGLRQRVVCPQGLLVCSYTVGMMNEWLFLHCRGCTGG
jgi:hypothetical protein